MIAQTNFPHQFTFSGESGHARCSWLLCKVGTAFEQKRNVTIRVLTVLSTLPIALRLPSFIAFILRSMFFWGPGRPRPLRPVEAGNGSGGIMRECAAECQESEFALQLPLKKTICLYNCVCHSCEMLWDCHLYCPACPPQRSVGTAFAPADAASIKKFLEVKITCLNQV